MTISARRAANYRRGISTTIQLPVQTVIALGATLCLALMSWHYATYMDRIWESHLEGAMIALLSIITSVPPLSSTTWALTDYEQHCKLASGGVYSIRVERGQETLPPAGDVCIMRRLEMQINFPFLCYSSYKHLGCSI